MTTGYEGNKQMLGPDTHWTRRAARRLAIVAAASAVGAALFTLVNHTRAQDDHAGHDHGTPAGQEGGGGKRTGDDARRRYGIVVQEVGAGKLSDEISLSGEIRLNDDRVAHLAPRVGGVVREVRKTTGDRVDAGELLAVLESAELGEAKADYLAKLNEVGCCKILVPRLQAVHDNTLTLLKFLDGEPVRDSLRKFANLPMGGNRSKLVGSYSELLLSRRNYARERVLRDKQIAGEQGLLDAENALEKAEAHYVAERDSIAFEIQRDLSEALAELRRTEFELKQAERHLQFLGIEAEEIRHLAELVTGAPESDCPDSNCSDCRAANGPAEKAEREARKTATERQLTRYELTAPFAGMIIERDIALGEHVTGESDVFTIADLSTVWVDLRVHERHLSAIEERQTVTIQSRPGLPETQGIIDYVHPVIDPETRTALARVVLANAAHQLRPGTFVTALVTGDENEVGVVVDRDAVQYLGDQPVVFVDDVGKFKPREVILGSARNRLVEIVFGLEAGERIAVKNSSRLKAELAKQTAGAAGGCSSHAH